MSRFTNLFQQVEPVVSHTPEPVVVHTEHAVEEKVVAPKTPKKKKELHS